MTIDWILTVLILIFIIASEFLREEANHSLGRIRRLFYNSFAKFIEYCIIGSIVALLFKYYKLV
jgi:hypothetical protein